MKLELERIYKEYCRADIDLTETDEHLKTLDRFIDFRLFVSGGNDHGCSESMTNVDNFINEIVLFSDLMSDYAGCYRGDLSYENLEALEALLDESSLDDNVKNEIIDKFKTYYEIEDE